MDILKAQKYSLLGKEPYRDSSPTGDVDLKDEIDETLRTALPEKSRLRHILFRGLWYSGLLIIVSTIAFFSGWELALKLERNTYLDTAWRKTSPQKHSLLLEQDF